jgi:hypothetical protein
LHWWRKPDYPWEKHRPVASGTFPKTIERHFTKNLPHTSIKRCLISIPLFSHNVPCKGPSWSRSYGSFILQLPVQSVPITTTVESLTTFMAKCTRYNSMLYNLPVTCNRSVFFSG